MMLLLRFVRIEGEELMGIFKKKTSALFDWNMYNHIVEDLSITMLATLSLDMSQ